MEERVGFSAAKEEFSKELYTSKNVFDLKTFANEQYRFRKAATSMLDYFERRGGLSGSTLSLGDLKEMLENGSFNPYAHRKILKTALTYLARGLTRELDVLAVQMANKTKELSDENIDALATLTAKINLIKNTLGEGLDKEKINKTDINTEPGINTVLDNPLSSSAHLMSAFLGGGMHMQELEETERNPSEDSIFGRLKTVHVRLLEESRDMASGREMEEILNHEVLGPMVRGYIKGWRKRIGKENEKIDMSKSDFKAMGTDIILMTRMPSQLRKEFITRWEQTSQDIEKKDANKESVEKSVNDFMRWILKPESGVSDEALARFAWRTLQKDIRDGGIQYHVEKRGSAQISASDSGGIVVKLPYDRINPDLKLTDLGRW